MIATVDAGSSVSAMAPLALTGTGLSATTGTLLGNAQIDSSGQWSPQQQGVLQTTKAQLTVNVPTLSAMLLQST